MTYNRILTIVLFYSIPFITEAQVSLGRTENTNSSVILEFNDERFTDGKQKGLILPSITDLETNAADGTLVFHVDGNNSSLKIKNENTWQELSSTSNHNVSPNYPLTSERTIISDGTSTLNSNSGLLVLNSKQRAMVLPNINGVESFPNPNPGILVYDSTRKCLAFFNGEEWSFIYGE